MKIASEKEIQDFADLVRKSIDSEVSKVLLFGSYARGDHVPGSDIDIAFLVSEVTEKDKKITKDIQKQYMKQDLLFSPKLIEEKEFEQKVDEGFVFHESIADEGVQL